MGLIDNVVPVRPPMPPAMAFKMAKVKSLQIYQILEKMHTELFKFLWENPDVTIEQFMVKYGPDAAALFQVSAKIQEVLATVNPEYTPLTPLKPITINEDGTVTVGG